MYNIILYKEDLYMDSSKLDDLDRIEYLAKMLNSRTYGKKYENFVINAIYTKINNYELKPITQQFVHNINERVNHKHYFLDLYFPQLNYGIEVDEGHHHELYQQQKDIIRAENIFVATNIKEGRIKIFKNDGKTLRQLSDINKQIDNEVLKINQKIAKQKKSLKWLTRNEEMEEIKKQGFLDVETDFEFAGILEILNFFEIKTLNGTEYKSYQHAYKEDFFIGYSLWVPHWSTKNKNGDYKDKNGWINFPGTRNNGEILEINEVDIYNTQTSDKKSGYQNEDGRKRIVFMHMKNRFGQNCVRFIGVFELYRIYRKNGQCYRCYKRKQKKIIFANLKTIHNDE